MAAHFEPLTATDASFLRIETAHEPQHVGSLSVLDGAPLRDARGRVRIDELRDHVARRIERVPRLRQRVMDVPLAMGRPVWIDDLHFDIDYHVRLTALPRPGDDRQLTELMSRLQSIPLDRDRPLWEMWFVDGLEGDDIGLVIKTHHALGDGIANVDLALALVDLEPRPPDPAADEPWRPRPVPSGADLLQHALGAQLTQPFRLARRTVGAIVDPRPFVDAASSVVRTAVAFLDHPPAAPWNRDVSPHRRWVHADVSLEAVAEVRAHHDATINDVVLAACAGALRRFLLDHEQSLPERPYKAMVPVSNRTHDQHGDTLGNLISLVLVDLPIDADDPLERLDRVHAATTAVKGSNLVQGTKRIIELADGIPQIATPLTRFVSRQIPMNLAITNIPGPPVPLYLGGARIRRVYPYVEVIDHEGLTIAVVSYDDHLFFGLTSDRDVLPDLGHLAEGIEKEFQVLAVAAAHR